MEEKNYALVTGASSGIGLAMAKELARAGYPLLLVSNEEEKIAEATVEIGKTFSVKTIPLYMDLAKTNSAQAVFDFCEAGGIKIEVLVNNAGIFFFMDICATSPERIETVLNLHVFTPTMLCRLFAGQMLAENRKGWILNTASIAAQMMMPGITLYNATKSYLRCFSRSMRNEVYGQNISITTVCPGAVATGLYGLAPGYMKLGKALGIIMTPERLARLALKKMFRKKAEYVPGGFINRLFILLVNILPQPFIRYLKRKIDLRMKNEL